MTGRILSLAVALLTLAPLALGAAGPPTPTQVPRPESEPGTMGPGCSLGGGVTALVEGVATTASLADESGASCEFSFVPAAGSDMVRFVLPPTSPADFDLFVRRGALPGTVTGSFDCRPFLDAATTELCELPVADDATYYAMVRRFTGSGPFELTATSHSTCSLGRAPLLADATSRAGSVADTGTPAASSGAGCTFVYSSSPAHDQGTFNMTPTPGNPAGTNFDVYVRKGAPPTPLAYDCRSILAGGLVDSCTTTLDPALTTYVWVRRVNGSGAFSLLAGGFTTCSLGGGVHTIGEGEERTASLTSHAGAACIFQFPAEYLQGHARLVLTPTTSDFDLYVRRSAVPTTTAYDCRPLLGGTQSETCTVELTEPEPVYAMIRRTTGSGAFTLRASSLSFCSLGGGIHALADGVPREAAVTGDAGAKCFFSFVPAASSDFIRFILPPTAPADLDLSVRKGALPTGTRFDCRPLLGGGSEERCELLTEGGVTYYAMVRRFGGSGAFSLTARDIVLPVLRWGQPVQGVVGDGFFDHYKVVVPPGSDLLAVALASPRDPAYACHVARTCVPTTFQDADLYVRHVRGGALPTRLEFDCASKAPGTQESCIFSDDLFAQSGPDPLNGDVFGQSIGRFFGPDTPLQVQPFAGGGKHFVSVYGAAGPAEYVIVVLHASSEAPGATLRGACLDAVDAGGPPEDAPLAALAAACVLLAP